MIPYYQDASVTIFHGDCREVLPTLGPVSLIATDPPYNGVLSDDWDNQWESDGHFIEWLGDVVALLDGRLADNGTLYLFSSPRLAARVETLVSERLRVIASAVWDKGSERGGAAGSGIDVTALRTFWASNTERVTVAEKRSNGVYLAADDAAREASGYWSACEAGKRGVFGDYLRSEIASAGITAKRVASLFPSRTGGLTGCVSNWLLGLNIPTREQYEAIRSLLNGASGGDFLRREYDDLRREYDDLRREYDDLRRPFFLHKGMQWGDVWRFGIERNRSHPAQKPLSLMGHIVAASSRAGDVVLDAFMGSGSTLRAAKDLGRRAIGIEIDERYCEIASRRCSQETLDLGAA